MTKPAFIYFDKSASPDFSRRPLSSLTRRIYSNRRSYLAWCKDGGVQGGTRNLREDISILVQLLQRFQRVLPSRERSASKEEEEEGEGSSVENGGGRILPRKSIFFVETSFRRGWFKRREAASLARKHVLTGCSLGSSWFFSCVEDIVLVVNGFYERGYSFPTRDRGDCVCTVSF